MPTVFHYIHYTFGRPTVASTFNFCEDNDSERDDAMYPNYQPNPDQYRTLNSTSIEWSVDITSLNDRRIFKETMKTVAKKYKYLTGLDFIYREPLNITYDDEEGSSEEPFNRINDKREEFDCTEVGFEINFVDFEDHPINSAIVAKAFPDKNPCKIWVNTFGGKWLTYGSRMFLKYIGLRGEATRFSTLFCEGH